MASDTLEALAARVDALERQVSEIFSRLNNTREAQAGIAEKLNGVLVTLGEVKQAVNTLQKAPGNRWETVVIAAISAVIAAAVGFVFSKI